MNKTEVKVVKYPDRKNLVLRWIAPETGHKKTRSAKTSRRREAERAAARMEANLAVGKMATADKMPRTSILALLALTEHPFSAQWVAWASLGMSLRD